MVSNIYRAIETRCDDLDRVKKGATVGSEPKVIWVKMIDRLGCKDKALAVRSKFSSVLEDVLSNYTNHYIMDVSKQMTDAKFFIKKTITTEGAIHYWFEIDNIIKLVDAREISLKPIKASEQPGQCYRMPPPPPMHNSSLVRQESSGLHSLHSSHSDSSPSTVSHGHRRGMSSKNHNSGS